MLTPPNLAPFAKPTKDESTTSLILSLPLHKYLKSASRFILTSSPFERIPTAGNIPPDGFGTNAVPTLTVKKEFDNNCCYFKHVNCIEVPHIIT